jgi:hypothetical protein
MLKHSTKPVFLPSVFTMTLGKAFFFAGVFSPWALPSALPSWHLAKSPFLSLGRLPALLFPSARQKAHSKQIFAVTLDVV